MRWVLRLIGMDDEARSRSTDLMEISRPASVAAITDLGLTLSEAKRLLRSVQQAVVAGQTDEHGRLRPDCQSCNGVCRVKDWRSRRIATLFGEAVVRLPRFLCGVCRRITTSTTSRTTGRAWNAGPAPMTASAFQPSGETDRAISAFVFSIGGAGRHSAALDRDLRPARCHRSLALQSP